jgi:hypothetical protein
MKKPLRLLAGTLIFLFFIGAAERAAHYENNAHAHLVRYPDHPQKSVLENREASQQKNLKHARYVARHGANRNQRWHRQAVRWISEELLETRRTLRPKVTDWAAIQMHYGRRIALASAGDPWPNCADPFDGSGASWQRLVNCENGGSWLDSPGYYRCGIQADPMWERYYGRRFCP